jgi:hypothetical protein
MKSRKHYNKLLNQLNINLHDLIKWKNDKSDK